MLNATAQATHSRMRKAESEAPATTSAQRCAPTDNLEPSVPRVPLVSVSSARSTRYQNRSKWTESGWKTVLLHGGLPLLRYKSKKRSETTSQAKPTILC